jgi:hypothetical protein
LRSLSFKIMLSSGREEMRRRKPKLWKPGQAQKAGAIRTTEAILCQSERGMQCNLKVSWQREFVRRCFLEISFGHQ